jgi:Mg2+ and Co2+ transporter CorA
MVADGHLLLVLHEPPKSDEPNRRARFFWRAPDGVWQSSNLGSGIASLKRHVGEYAASVEKLDQAEERAEASDEYFQLFREIAPLRRAACNLHDTLQEARQAVSDDPDLIVCRDQAYQVQRSADLVQGDIQSGLDCAVARRAEEQAKSSYQMALAAHRLNVLAAVFFPIVTISSVLGMNLSRGLDEEMFSQWVFWLVLAAGVGFGLLLKGAVIDKPVRPNGRDPNKQV